MLILTNYCTIPKLNWCDWARTILLFCDAQKNRKKINLLLRSKRKFFYAWKFMTLFCDGSIFWFFEMCFVTCVTFYMTKRRRSYFWKKCAFNGLNAFVRRDMNFKFSNNHTTTNKNSKIFKNQGRPSHKNEGVLNDIVRLLGTAKHSLWCPQRKSKRSK